MRILYATDGSKGALAAAQLLARLPLDERCRLMVLTVAPHYEEGKAMAALASAREVLCHLPVCLTTHTGAGDPTDAIVQMATEYSVNLVVVGTRGLSPIQRFFLGSVAEGVARRAPCPVLMVRPGHSQVLRVVVGIDGSAAAARAVDWLRHFPLPLDCEVRLVTALRSLDDVSDGVMLVPRSLNERRARQNTEQQHEKVRRQLEELAAVLGAAGKRVVTEAREGDLATTLLQVAEDEDEHLIVVGTRGQRGAERFMVGSLAEHALHHARCSVLVVNHRHEAAAQLSPGKRTFLVVVKRTLMTRWLVEADTTAEASTLVGRGIGSQVDADQAPEETEVMDVYEFAPKIAAAVANREA